MLQPLTADETLVPGTFPEYFRALKDAVRRFDEAQMPLIGVYIWQGRLIARSTSVAYVYRVFRRPCPYCGCEDTRGEAEVS